MHIFNSLSQKNEEFVPIHANCVSIYVCGPTVYNYPHVGNVRPLVVFDTLKRFLEASNYKVKLVSNYTDVDDKIINAASAANVNESQISAKYIEAYNNDRKSLNVKSLDASPRVSENMDEIIAFIVDLVKKGYAYEIDGDVYFRVNMVSEYGRLSNQNIDDLIVGSRVDENTKKENPLDFTLWKKTDAGLRWESVFSTGRPGWHSECVVMINQEFNHEMIDIHGGGMDLKFPHHENEIAQSIAQCQHGLAKYWMHNGMVNMNGEKMSKSLGNIIWAKDLIAKIGGNALRWIMLSAHYRAPLNISDAVIETAITELGKINMVIKQADLRLALLDNNQQAEIEKNSYQEFCDALNDDLNTPNAYAIIFKQVKMLNQALRQKLIEDDQISSLVSTLKSELGILGITYDQLRIDSDDLKKYRQWQNAMSNKNFAEADQLRNILQQKGLL